VPERYESSRPDVNPEKRATRHGALTSFVANALDKRDPGRHPQTAMTTALARVPALPTRVAAACALFIFVVISILPR